MNKMTTTQRTVMAMIYIRTEDEAEGVSEVGETIAIVSKRREEGREREGGREKDIIIIQVAKTTLSLTRFGIH